MTRLTRLAFALALVLVLGALMGACGSSSKKSSSAPKANTQEDALAKAHARTAATEIEACYVDQAAYTGCEPSQAGVTATTTDTSYKLVAQSKSGNSFVLAKDANGAVSRTCTTTGNGGCPAAGSW